VQTWQRTARLNEDTPLTFIECVPSIFPVEGAARSIAPGTRFEYELPDIFGRPWAQIWERYREPGMQRPAEEDIFAFPEAAPASPGTSD
jgi:hypothetical protein